LFLTNLHSMATIQFNEWQPYSKEDLQKIKNGGWYVLGVKYNGCIIPLYNGQVEKDMGQTILNRHYKGFKNNYSIPVFINHETVPRKRLYNPANLLRAALPRYIVQNSYDMFCFINNAAFF